MSNNKKVMLLIMDGWGLGQKSDADAIQHAKVPFYQSLFDKYPHATLTTCGTEVGLPEGQMGNSEVGHLNLGAGRIVYQELQRINLAVKEKTLLTNAQFQSLIDYAHKQQKPIHLIGLVSDGGVHAHIDHLIGILDLLHKENLPVFIHAFTDGRDTDPQSGKKFIAELEQACKQTNAKIASISGRYYAMDRDKRWERIKKAYDTMVHGKGNKAQSAQEVIDTSYQNEVTDEFILPTSIVDKSGEPIATIQDGDAVFCFNFRTDRCREITEVLSQKDFEEYEMKKLSLHYTTMTNYDKSFSNVEVIFSDDPIPLTLGEVLANNGKKQIRIAETEKYPHVTYFFSGGRETPFEGEKRIIIPSPKVATYDLQPTMSAEKITDSVLAEIDSQSADFICLNFANADMVGHTGVWEAVVKAVETVDKCVSQIVEACLANDYIVLLTADHGNADYMKNDDGSPNTAHSLNLVPLFLIGADKKWNLSSGKLGDIAPTILTLMGIEIPEVINGKVLIH